MFPIDDEVSLYYTVLAPVETHVASFGASLANGVVGDANSARIVLLGVGSEWLVGGWHMSCSVVRSIAVFPVEEGKA
jgi:hypothetical protein